MQTHTPIIPPCHHPRFFLEQMGESGFLVPFFNFFYYVGLIPFKIELDTEKNQYFLKSSIPIKIICGITNLIVLLFFCYMTVLSVPDIRKEDPTIILAIDFCCNLTSILSVVTLMRQFWWHKSSLLEVLECTRAIKPAENTKRTCLLIWLGIMLVAFSMGFYGTTAMEDGKRFELNPAFYADNETILDWKHHKKNMSTSSLDTVCYLGKMALHWIFLYASLYYLTSQVVIAMLVLTLRNLSKECEEMLEMSQQENNFEQGLFYQKKLKTSTDIIRRVYGDVLLLYYITSVCYYAIAPHVFLADRNPMEKVVVVYFFGSSVVWKLAADFHYKVRQAVLSWVNFFSEHEFTSGERKIQLLITTNEMLIDPIALSSKYFSLTYTHIGNMISVIFTYGIIVLQLHQQASATQE